MNIRDSVYPTNDTKIMVAEEIERLEKQCRCEEVTAALILLIDAMWKVIRYRDK